MSQEQGTAKHDEPLSLPGVRRLIAVGSGKGGVGKSTVAVNLALALARKGRSVGVIDADLQGPSVGMMLGISPAARLRTSEQRIQPVEAHGMPVVTMSLLLAAGEAAAWRGPMLGKVLTEFVRDTDWGELDVLVVDLPPGTGDVPMSLAQSFRLDGVLLVTTPQGVAFADVRRAAKLFGVLNVPVLGLVENMSWFPCPDTGKRHEIFGPSRGTDLAAELGVPLMGRFPLDPFVTEEADHGRPIVVAAPDGETARLYAALAEQLDVP